MDKNNSRKEHKVLYEKVSATVAVPLRLVFYFTFPPACVFLFYIPLYMFLFQIGFLLGTIPQKMTRKQFKGNVH